MSKETYIKRILRLLPSCDSDDDCVLKYHTTDEAKETFNRILGGLYDGFGGESDKLAGFSCILLKYSMYLIKFTSSENDPLSTTRGLLQITKEKRENIISEYTSSNVKVYDEVPKYSGYKEAYQVVDYEVVFWLDVMGWDYSFKNVMKVFEPEEYEKFIKRNKKSRLWKNMKYIYCSIYGK